MGIRRKKGQCGEATLYINRNRAAKMLQIPLPEFRRLCILKGIYPREPSSRKKAQRGDSNIKTLYLKKDIIYLSHEPIIWKIRDEKIFKREHKTLESKRQKSEAAFKRKYQRPTYKLDHMVLERYPTFDKALQDLDDPISTCFLYSAVPNIISINSDLVQACRRLTTEFLNYVIESRSLRKAFISIKGYFYRATIQGHHVTWMVPHPFQPEVPAIVDMRVMRIFVEFYVSLLGFVNFKLFQGLNLYYPPVLAAGPSSAEAPPPATLRAGRSRSRKGPNEEALDVIQSLATPLRRRTCLEEEDEDGDHEYDMEIMKVSSSRQMKASASEQQKLACQMRVFEGVKFFLGRETNHESLTLVIRSAGGKVSWDGSSSSGSSFPEEDRGILYEVVDRPQVEKKVLTRYYVQPQWVYDSFNAGVALPVQDYFVGASLPAHLSPFEETYKGKYAPPEFLRTQAAQGELALEGDRRTAGIFLEGDGEEEEEEEKKKKKKEEEEEEECEEEMDTSTDDEDKTNASALAETDEADSDQEEEEEEDEEKGDKSVSKAAPAPQDPLAKMAVQRGRPQRRNADHERRQQEADDVRLATILIHRKQKRLFKRIRDKERRVMRWSEDLKRKRMVFEKEMRRRREKKRDGGQGQGAKGEAEVGQ